MNPSLCTGEVAYVWNFFPKNTRYTSAYELMCSREYGCVLGCRRVCVVSKDVLRSSFSPFIFFPIIFLFPLFPLSFQTLVMVNLPNIFCSLVCQVLLAPFLPSRAFVGKAACMRSSLDFSPVWCVQSRASVCRAHRVKRVAVVES